MDKILSRISGPLLISSILALGALAFPIHADAADGPLIVFRAQSGLIDRPQQVADNGDTGTGTGTGAETSPGDGEAGTGGTGDGSGDSGEDGSGGDDTGDDDTTGGEEAPARYLTMTYEGGYSLSCPTDWTAEFVAAHQLGLSSLHTAKPGKYGTATLKLQRHHTAPGVGTVKAENAWFTLLKATDPSAALPTTFPMVLNWGAMFEPDPRPWQEGFPCSGDVTVDGPELTVEPGLTRTVKLTAVSVE
jgi:hypothetical protein